MSDMDPDPWNERDDFEEINANEANDYLHEDTDEDEIKEVLP